jgi:glycosyltransferase involved in cell wall biosynthesis
VLWSRQVGGIETYVADFCRASEPLSWESHAYCVEEPADAYLRARGVPIRWSAARGLPRLATPLLRALRAGSYDVVVAHRYAGYLLLPFLRRTRTVAVLHSEQLVASGWRPAKAALVGRILSRALSHADHLVAVSEHVARHTDVPLPTNVPLTVVLTGVDRSRRAPVVGGLPAERPAIALAFVGRLVTERRPEYVIDVAAELAKTVGATVSVHYFGEGPMRAALRDRAAASAVPVVLHGWTDDARYEAAAADATLVVSDVEGLGLAGVEVALSGGRVFASRIGGRAELLDRGLGAEISHTDASAAAKTIANGLGQPATPAPAWPSPREWIEALRPILRPSPVGS